MKYCRIQPDQLTAADIKTWRQIQQETPYLRSPYFCPEFTLAVAAVRDDVQITILKEGGRTVGFFPFQKNKMGAAKPVGGILSDYHGVVVSPETSWSTKDLLCASGLSYWHFDHLIAEQAPFRRFHRRWGASPALDLSDGFTAYRNRRRASGWKIFSQLNAKARKLARDIGPLQFVSHTTDKKILEQVFLWKSEQCRQTNGTDFFQWDWTRKLLEKIWQTQEPQFSGKLSALYAGDNLVAAHMGMRSSSVWHWWFPVYNKSLAKYSPGLLILGSVAEHAAQEGMQQLDLGKGTEVFKNDFADTANPIAEGYAWRPSIFSTAKRITESAENSVRDSQLWAPLRPALRQIKRRLYLSSAS